MHLSATCVCEKLIGSLICTRDIILTTFFWSKLVFDCDIKGAVRRLHFGGHYQRQDNFVCVLLFPTASHVKKKLVQHANRNRWTRRAGVCAEASTYSKTKALHKSTVIESLLAGRLSQIRCSQRDFGNGKSYSSG